MTKWADYLISAVSYSPNREIIEAEVHEDLDGKIGRTEIVDKITMSHNIRKGKTYITVFKTLNSWKRGQEIHLYSVNGHPYLRIDRNKVNMDHLGDIPDIDHNKKKDPSLTVTTPTGEKKTGAPPPPKPADAPKPELKPELKPEPASENKEAKPPSPHGALPAEGDVEIPFEDTQPDLATDAPTPEPEPEPSEIKAKPKGNTHQEFLEYEQDYLRRLEEQKKQQEELADQARSEQKKQQESERQARLQHEEAERQKHKTKTSKPAETANLRGSLPAEGEIEIPFEQEQPPEATEGEIGHSEGQEMDFDDDDEDEDPTPEQLAKFEELEKQLEDMVEQSEQADATSDPEEPPPFDVFPPDQGRTETTSGSVRAADEPEPKPEPGDETTRKQFEQIAALSDKINELEAALASSPKADPAPQESEPETVRDIIEKFDEAFDEQVARLEKLEEHIGEIEDYDVESVLLEKLHRQTNKMNSIEERIAGSRDATQEQLDRAAALEKQIAELEKKKARADAVSDVVAYCVRCKAKRNMSNPKATVMKNGRPATKGACSVCGAGMFRIGSSKPKKEDDVPTKEQIDRVAKLEKQIENLERRQPSAVSGYCVKCRSKRGMANPEQTVMKNGKPAIRGTCPVCGTRMSKIGKM